MFLSCSHSVPPITPESNPIMKVKLLPPIIWAAAIDAGCPDGELEKGLVAYQQDNFRAAFDHFKNAAERGNVEAQYELGYCYYWGEGVEENKIEAVKWYRKAAEQGNVHAQNDLGVCYANGEGVEEDKAEAVKWYRKAAEQGYSDAQDNLGYCYANGEGVEENIVEAGR